MPFHLYGSRLQHKCIHIQIHTCMCRDLYVVQASIGFGVRCGNVVYVADVWVYRILKNISNLVSRIVVVPVAFVVIGFCCSCKRKRKLQPPQAEAENACLKFVLSFTFTFRHKMKNQSFDQKWIWLTDWLTVRLVDSGRSAKSSSFTCSFTMK